MMDIESFRTFCLALPHTTETIQWGNDLVFKIGGKMYAVAVLDETSPNRASFKCTPEKFAELIEQENIIPAPYSARYHWVALQSWDALSKSELTSLLRDSYEMVRSCLPKKVQTTLESNPQKKKMTGKTTGRK